MLVVKDLESFDKKYEEYGFTKKTIGKSIGKIVVYQIHLEEESIEDNEFVEYYASVLIGRYGSGGVNGRVYIYFHIDSEHYTDELYVDDTFYLPKIVVDLIKEGIIDYE